MTKNQTVELLKQQLPGFYSVEQVIKMINDIEDSSEAFDKEKQQNLQELIIEQVTNYLRRLDSSDIADYDSAEFELSGNEISVYSIDVNTDTVIDEVHDAINDAFNKTFNTVA